MPSEDLLYVVPKTEGAIPRWSFIKKADRANFPATKYDLVEVASNGKSTRKIIDPSKAEPGYVACSPYPNAVLTAKRVLQLAPHSIADQVAQAARGKVAEPSTLLQAAEHVASTVTAGTHLDLPI